MQKRKLLALGKIIDERICLLTEEIEVVTSARLNQLYLTDLKDEVVSLQWATRILRWILNRAIDSRQQLGVSEVRLELEDTEKFENILHDKIQELEIELEDSNNDREKEVVINEIQTLKYVLGYLFNLKYSEKARATEIVKANNNRWQENRLIKTQDAEC